MMPLSPNSNALHHHQQPHKVIRLPHSSTRLQKSYAHLTLVERVRPVDSVTAFEGRFCKPGSNVRTEDLPPSGLALECVGPVKVPGERKYPLLWKLWQYDYDREEWKLLGEAQSVGREWVYTLREIALDVIRPRNPMVDLIGYGNKLSRSIIEELDTKLEAEMPDVKRMVLEDLHVQVSARIAAAISNVFLNCWVLLACCIVLIAW